MTAEDFKKALQKHVVASDSQFLQRFFKTGKGQYGEGDVFIGVRVPMTRAVCRQFVALPLSEIQELFASPIHEHRLAAVIILSSRYKRSTPEERSDIFDIYLKNLHSGRINNWDLIDASAEFIIGPHLQKTTRDLLVTLARSNDLWSRRAAIMSAFYYLKQGDADTTLKLAKQLLYDKQDLIQKAVGWQLREVGKKVDRQLLLNFLDKYAATMPRTMLRYAIEHLDSKQRSHYMSLK